MLQAIAFGLAVGAGVQAWRNWPADGPVTADAAAVVFVVGVLLAYVGGRWRGRRGSSASATAVASASAEARSASVGNAVNLLVVAGDGPRPTVTRVPDDAVPWMGSPRPALDQGDLEGLDLSELLDLDPEHDGRER